MSDYEKDKAEAERQWQEMKSIPKEIREKFILDNGRPMEPSDWVKEFKEKVKQL